MLKGQLLSSAEQSPAAENPGNDPLVDRFGSARMFRLRGADVSALGDGNGVAIANLGYARAMAVQPSAGNRPLYKSVVAGDAVRFTSASSHYLETVIGSIDPALGLTVVAMLDARNTGRVFSLGVSDTSESAGAYAWSVTESLATAPGGVARAAFTDYTVNSSGLALFSHRYSGCEIASWLNSVKRNGTVFNGTEQSDGSFRPTTLLTDALTKNLQFGRRVNSGGSQIYFDGDLIDMVLVFGVVVDEEVKFIEGVLANEHAATALLPIGHPWKSSAPTFASAIPTIWGGPVVARSRAPATQFLSSPSFLKGSDGTFYMLHDFFTDSLSTGGDLYVSTDSGVTWTLRTSFAALFWGKLWAHTDGNLYILSVTTEYGDLQIGKSTDKGITWTWATLSGSGGPVAAAGTGTTPPNYARAATNALYHDDHIFFGVENLDPYVGIPDFKTFLIYAPAASDLMNKANWTATAEMALGAHSYAADSGFLESTPVVDDAGQVWSVVRFQGADVLNKAVFLPIAWNGSAATMPTWSASYIKDFPGGQAKFDLVKSGNFFYAVVNHASALGELQRNRSSLIRTSSASLASPSFTTVQTLIAEADVLAYTGMDATDSRALHGFQYASFMIDGSTLRVGYRLGWSGSNSYHNSNFIGYGEFAL